MKFQCEPKWEAFCDLEVGANGKVTITQDTCGEMHFRNVKVIFVLKLTAYNDSVVNMIATL